MAPATLDPVGTALWLALMKAHRAVGRHAARDIATAGLGLSEFATLELLLHKGPQLVSEIGRYVDLTSGAITTAIDRLAERELVIRRTDPEDRRARVVSLTPAGTALIGGVFRTHKLAMAHATGGLTRNERATLFALLKKLGRSADERFVHQENSDDKHDPDDPIDPGE